MTHQLIILPELFAICRLDAHAEIPPWALAGKFLSITRTPTELSIVCPQLHVPAGIRCERDWRCLGIVGTLDFSLVGVLSTLITPLAEAGISVFAVSTFDTDYLLVKAAKWDEAVAVLRQAGHSVS